MRIYKLSLLICVLLFMAACSGQQQDGSIPTMFPTAAENDTNAQSLPTDVPPSATVMPKQPPPTAGQIDFPPTWTFTPEPSETPVPATITPQPPAATHPGPLPACDTFEPDYSQIPSEFAVGAEPTISWTPVAGALNYEVLLTEEATGKVILDEYTDQTSYTFPADRFEADKRYGWSVTPYDTRLIQMCVTIGDVFNVTQ